MRPDGTSRILARMPVRRRTFTRERRYDAHLTVTVPRATVDAVTAVADLADTSVSAIVRACIDRGLPLVRDSARKRRAAATSSGGGSDGA